MKNLVIAACLASAALGGVAGTAEAGDRKVGISKKWHGNHKWKHFHRKWHVPHYYYDAYYYGDWCWKYKKRYHRTGKRYWLKKFRNCRFHRDF